MNKHMTPIRIVGYGTTLVSHIPGVGNIEDPPGVVRATFESMCVADGHHDTTEVNGEVIVAKWRLDLFPNEALELAEALIRHARGLGV